MKKQMMIVVGFLVASLGMSATAEVSAQVCTTNNWSSIVPVEGTNLKVGTAADGNRRYAGPCGLNVDLKGVEAYLADDSPTDEANFNVRFYFFLNGVESDVTFYQALDGATAVITAKYDESDNEVDVVFGASQEVFRLGPVSSGWNSLEIQWESDATATLRATLANASDTFTDTASNVDTSAFAVDSARLGAINALVANMPSAGSIDFDDYDSRRSGTMPGRLVRGDANGDGVTDGDDQSAVVNEFLLGEFGQGNPDCNEDGLVDGDDQSCIVNVFLGIE